jgi:hypothetical protein
MKCLPAELSKKMIAEATGSRQILLRQFRRSARKDAMQKNRVLPNRVDVKDVIIGVVTYWYQVIPSLQTDLHLR